MSISINLLSQVSDPAYSSWLYQIIDKVKQPNQGYEKFFSQRRSIFMLAKLAGFSLGPILYGLFNSNFIAINILISLLGTMLLIKVPCLSFKDTEITKSLEIISSFKKIIRNNVISLLLKIDFITGATILNFTTICVMLIKLQENSSIYISIYWFGTTIASFITSTILSKIDNINNQKLMQSISLITYSISIILIIISQHIYTILIASIISSMSLVPYYIIHDSNYYRIIDKIEDKSITGRVFGVSNFVENIAIIIFLLISYFINYKYVLIIMLLLTFIKIFYTIKVYSCSSIPNNTE